MLNMVMFSKKFFSFKVKPSKKSQKSPIFIIFLYYEITQEDKKFL